MNDVLNVRSQGSECLGAALRVLATGGVYIAGGIPPKILPLITETPVLIKAFENCSPPMRDVVTRFPLKVVSDPNVGLLGAKVCYQFIDLSCE